MLGHVKEDELLKNNDEIIKTSAINFSPLLTIITVIVFCYPRHDHVATADCHPYGRPPSCRSIPRRIFPDIRARATTTPVIVA